MTHIRKVRSDIVRKDNSELTLSNIPGIEFMTYDITYMRFHRRALYFLPESQFNTLRKSHRDYKNDNIVVELKNAYLKGKKLETIDVFKKNDNPSCYRLWPPMIKIGSEKDRDFHFKGLGKDIEEGWNPLMINT